MASSYEADGLRCAGVWLALGEVVDALGSSEVLLFDDFRLDRRGLFRRDDTDVFAPVKIGSRALELLRLLIKRPGELVTKDEMIAAIWGGTVVEDSNLTMQISILRRVLDQKPKEGCCIQTVAGHGYRFTAPVMRGTANSSAPAWPTNASSLVPRLSIVVLPFANLSADPEQEYFADAITDDLTADLSRIGDSFIIARTTAFTYKRKSLDVRHIARELGVRYVLEGSARQIGERVQVNVELLDGETGSLVWADRFETSRRDLPEAQSEITGRLARTLNLELAEAVGRRIERERAAYPDARDLVMRGWAWWYRRMSPSNRQEARKAFERALEIDSNSVEARIGLATILVSNIADGWSIDSTEDRARAEKLLLDALEFDPNRSMAHYAMAMVRRSQGRLIESKMEFEAAIVLDPNNARAHFNLGHGLIFLGEPELAMPHIEKALRLNPYDPNAANFYACLGLCHILLNDPDKAIEFLMKARTGNPRGFYVHLWLAAALGLQGNIEEAKSALAESLSLKPEINSLTRLREYQPWMTYPPYWTLREKTMNIGLRRAGFPE